MLLIRWIAYSPKATGLNWFAMLLIIFFGLIGNGAKGVTLGTEFALQTVPTWHWVPQNSTVAVSVAYLLVFYSGE